MHHASISTDRVPSTLNKRAYNIKIQLPTCETAMSDGYTDNSEDEVWVVKQSPGFLLWHLENLWQREQRRTLDPFGVTTVQFLLLSGLAASGAGETVSQIALAGRCRTDPMMTSQVVRNLAQMGLVKRMRDKVDRRAFAVRLTAEGLLP